MSASPAPRPPLYDLKSLRQLLDYDEAFVRQLIRLFIATTPPAVARLELHLRCRQLPELAAAAHFLKSSAEGLQLISLCPLLRELEAAHPAPSSPNWPRLAQLVGQVRAIVEEAVGQLQAERTE